MQLCAGSSLDNFILSIHFEASGSILGDHVIFVLDKIAVEQVLLLVSSSFPSVNHHSIIAAY